MPHRSLALTLSLAAAAVALSSAVTTPAAHGQGVERHYIANDDHTDYFWSGTDAQYRQAFLRTLDFYMTQAEMTANRPVDGRGRYNVDGSLWIWEYEHGRNAADFNRLVGHIRAGNISVPFQSLVLLPGAMPTEAVLRDMYYAGSLERRFGLDLDLAVNMENQTLPAGLASLWAGAGARYSWRGVCACATRVPLADLIDRPREIYRYTGLDGASVILKWNSMFGDNRGLGGYAEARDPEAIVQFMSQDGLFHQRWPWNIYAAFGYGWDDLETRTTAFIDASAALARPDRRVIVSNEVDFFEDFEASHGDELESFTGAFGNEWDLYVASMQSVAAPMRRAVEKLRRAEALAATVLLDDSDAIEPHDAERERAFLDMGLFYEHDWVANGEVPQPVRIQFQRDALARVQAYVDTLHGDALRALGTRIDARGQARYAVFNALGFDRTGPADLPHAGAGPFTVIDVATGDEVPSQRLAQGGGTLRILARDVPSVGYRVFEVRNGAGRNFGNACQANGATLDNGLVTARLRGDGALDSVVRNADGRSLLPRNGVWNLQGAAANAAVRVVDAGPVSATLEVSVASEPTHRTRVTLYRELDRVEIQNHVDENFTETVGYTFDFGVQNQVLHHEEVGAVLRMGRARNGGDYADVGTRTDFLTLNHFVDLSEDNFGVTLSSKDAQFFRAGNSDVETLDTATPRLFAVLGMQVDGRHLGIVEQGYDRAFDCDFALRAHDGYSAAEAMRFGLDHQTPLDAVRLSGGAGATLPPTRHSLFGVESDETVLFALKPSEGGIDEGLTVRLWNLGEGERNVSLRSTAYALRSARNVSHVEVDGDDANVVDGALEDALPRQGLRSYRLVLGAALAMPLEPDAGAPGPDAALPLDARLAPPDAASPGADARSPSPDDASIVDDAAAPRPDVALVLTDALAPRDGARPGDAARVPDVFAPLDASALGDGEVRVDARGRDDGSAPARDARPVDDGGAPLRDARSAEDARPFGDALALVDGRVVSRDSESSPDGAATDDGGRRGDGNRTLTQGLDGAGGCACRTVGGRAEAPFLVMLGLALWHTRRRRPARAPSD